MSSRCRLINKVRKNADYVAVLSWASRNGLSVILEPPTGKGHPKIVITDGTTMLRRPIACTPRSYINTTNVIANIERAWRQAKEAQNGQGQ